jgi:hypothetical protein
MNMQDINQPSDLFGNIDGVIKPYGCSRPE